MPASAAFTCVVADDHPAIVESVSRLLEATGEVEVVAQALDGQGALERIRELAPTVAVVDAQMPHLAAVEIASRLADEGALPGIVVYSELADPALAIAALDAGARGFVLKHGPLADLAKAVQIVAGGGTFVDPELSAAVNNPDLDRTPPLTEREREVLHLLADGLRNDEVAEQLAISPLTVRTHVKRAMDKLKAGTRTEAVATALRQSLIA